MLVAPQRPIELRLGDRHREDLVVVDHPLPADRWQRREVWIILYSVATHIRREVHDLGFQERRQVRNDATNRDHGHVWQLSAGYQRLELAKSPIRERSQVELEVHIHRLVELLPERVLLQWNQRSERFAGDGDVATIARWAGHGLERRLRIRGVTIRNNVGARDVRHDTL